MCATARVKAGAGESKGRKASWAPKVRDSRGEAAMSSGKTSGICGLIYKQNKA